MSAFGVFWNWRANGYLSGTTPKRMLLLKLFFKRLSVRKQADFMKRRGIVLGTRRKSGRQAYLYMVNSLFAEILYENDNPRLKVEALVVLDGLKNFNRYMENDVRSIGRTPQNNFWMS